MPQFYDFEAMRRHIMEGAAARGIDPMKAVEVFGYEGFQPGTWQSNVQQSYGRERSYGPAQLHVAPEGRKPGLGNAFMEKYGLDPADPKNAFKTTDYALDIVAQDGWKQWFGAKDHGISRWEGISKGAKPLYMMQASYSPQGRAPQGMPGVNPSPPGMPQGIGAGPAQGLPGAMAQGAPTTPPFNPAQGPSSPPQIVQPANAGPPKPPTGPGGGAYARIMAQSQANAGGLPQGRPMANPADMMKLKTSLMSMFQPKPPPLPVGGIGGAGAGGIGGGGGGLMAMLSGLFK